MDNRKNKTTNQVCIMDSIMTITDLKFLIVILFFFKKTVFGFFPVLLLVPILSVPYIYPIWS